MSAALSSTGKNRASAGAAAAKAALKETPPRSRSLPTRARDRRRTLIVSFAILFIMCSGGLAALVMEIPRTTEPVGVSRPDLDLRSVKVMTDTGVEGCTQKMLDNQSWRMSGSKQSCDPVLRDANGAPIPVGTIHRLDAINKSFMGK
jgi:hypothetical protein